MSARHQTNYPLWRHGWLDLDLWARQRAIGRDRGGIRRARSRAFDLPTHPHSVQVRVISCQIWIWSFGSGFAKQARVESGALSSLAIRRARSRSMDHASRDRERSAEIRGARSRSSDPPHGSKVRAIPCRIWILSFGFALVKHERVKSNELASVEIRRARSRPMGPTARDREGSSNRSIHFGASKVRVIPCHIWILEFRL